MVVCKFFQQGYCRYGQNCRFEHIYGSKYTYHANPAPQAAQVQSVEYSDEKLVNQVQADVQSALKEGQWILSCYAPFKERSNFPGISDLSPEEARLFIYEAKKNNNLDQAVAFMNNMFEETRQKYKQLLQPNTNIIKVLRSIYKGEVIPSPFTNTSQNNFGGDSAASSIFRSAVAANTAGSVFNQGQSSIFNTQPDPAKELFSRANNTSIFGQTSAPVSILGSTNQNEAKSIFASAVQNASSPFSQTNPSNIFSGAQQSVFGPAPNHNNSPFNQSPNSIFNQTQNTSPFLVAPQVQSTQVRTMDDPCVYSKLEELCETDLEAFKSDHFELGLVPEVAPPYQLCTAGYKN